jgi:hypothetical protein
MKKIIERWFNVFGYEVHVRAEPKEFKDDMRGLGAALNDERWEDYDLLFKKAEKRWDPNDPEMVRVATLASFLKAEDE